MMPETNKPSVYINALSIIAPGMFGMQQALPVLSGKSAWQYEELPRLTPELLPANERRRTTSYIKLALQVADDAFNTSELKKPVAAVFASSDGDFFIINNICEAINNEHIMISPTQFHNSVHNAAAGYWAIAANSSEASTSISTGDSTFSSGLVEAVTQACSSGKPVLFIAYDFPPIPPLDTKRAVTQAFATAFVLSTEKLAECYAAININVNHQPADISNCMNTTLDELKNSNPIARCLPLLEALCLKQNTRVELPYLLESSLSVEIQG